MLGLRGVSFGYAEAPVVKGIDLTFASGELVALTGPNGSGKSTLLKLLARVLTPDAGEIVFEGRPLHEWKAKEYARLVGYLPQEPDPAFPMRALDVVVSGRAPFLGRFAWESDADWEAAERALADCDAAHLADRDLDEMSGGERKRVFLARVLVAKPRLILLDEPLTALDIAHVQQFSRLLRDIVDRTGATVVYAVHDLNWAGAHSDRMLVMQDGSLVMDDVPERVLQPDVVRRLFAFAAEGVVVNGRTWIVPRV
jgi:iron complex transport system ATP-binding protein